jgi:hypothetical protein
MRLVRQILTAPLKLVLFVCAFFPGVNQLTLIGMVWKIGREPEYALRYIGLAGAKKGIEAAREAADAIFKECPTDQVAGIMGTLELEQYNLIRAKDWLEKGKQCPEEHPEFLLQLELDLSDHLYEYDAQAVITKILSRSDLPMNCSRMALVTQAEMFLRTGKWDEADTILERIFSIEELPMLRWMKWTVAKGKGDEIEAERQLRLANTKMHKTVPNVFLAVGWYYLGNLEKTRQYLTMAQQDGVTKQKIIRINRELGALLESDSSTDKQVEEAN